MPLQIRRGTEAERLAMTVPLAPGEPLYTTDQGYLYIGNGTTLGGIQVTGYNDEDAIDAIGDALKNGVHQNIVFQYEATPQDIANRIDSYIDLSYYDGEISAPAFRGSVLDDGSLTLVNATTGSINLDGTVKGDIVPDADEAYDIGSSTYKFRDLYLSGSSLYLGTAQITATGSIIDLPVGSTVGGLPISALEGIVPGSNYNANIIADDSSVMVDTSAQQMFALNGFIGNLTGNVNGNVSGDVTGTHFGPVSGNVAGNVTGNLIGNVTGDVIGNVTGDIKGSIFGDDSTKLVDSISSRIVGDIENSVTTSVQMFSSTINLTGLNDFGSAPGVVVISEYDDETPGSAIDIRTHIDSGDNGQSFIVSRSRGTISSPTSVQLNDSIFKFLFFGADSDGVNAFASAMQVVVDGTPTSGVVPSKFEIYTTNGAGNATLGLSIDSSQIIRVANNTVAANSGSGTADVTGGVLTYLKISVDGTEYAMPLYGIVP